MKSLITIGLIFCFSGFIRPVHAQVSSEQVGDSTEVQVGGIKIRMSDNGQPDAVEITMDPAVTHKTVSTEWAMMDIGINTFLQDGSFQLDGDAAPFNDLRYGRTWNLDMHLFRQRISLVQRKFNLEYGLTFSWHNYAFQNDVLITPAADEFAFETSDVGLRKSKMSATYLTVPLLLNLETNPDKKSNSFRLSAGMYGGVRIASRTKVKTEDKLKLKQRDDFNLNAFRYGPMVRIGYGWFNVYAQYALSDLFADNQGPELTPVTFGISIRAF
jgi:hypothetical protein